MRGAGAAYLPVDLPTRFEMAVDLDTAKLPGLTITQEVIVRATRVIE
jgi:hypothetical protein